MQGARMAKISRTKIGKIILNRYKGVSGGYENI